MRSPNKKWLPLEHKIWRLIQDYPYLQGSLLFLMVSGGRDSMALLNVFNHIKDAGNFDLQVIHIHHGGDLRLRDEWADFVKKSAVKLGIPCSVVRSPNYLTREEEMRKFRYQAALEVRNQRQFLNGHSYLVTAHHALDLLETRLIRLIRGCGPQGLTGIRCLRPPFFRPFLSVKPQEIIDYVEKRHIKFVQDPSNFDLRYLRNWLRHQWLPLLENRISGSVGRLSQSLELLADQYNRTADSQYLQVHKSKKMCRVPLKALWSLPKSEQTALIARCFLVLSGAGYTQGQIEETWRRVNNVQVQKAQWVCGGVYWHKRYPWLYARKHPVR
ncbi:MAG: tRNA lysidine(34) synthetase TilS [Bdellovibrionaceae bacterium]|nr:tRNA lysidine(34) synthetase TilS [Pseudobdellovibrionaceae bacterium]MDW8191188.1 tRNA lysidine(34) synthetase TilS [Pseudobdellovibrionaceae bacterium]